jgi:tyrosine-protein kinase Etk/Wzc
METLILNLNSIGNNQLENKVITITSPSPFNGKSTVSMKLAEYLSSIDKKVLLVDNDLKRGKLASNFNVDSISEKKFNTINESSISDYMIKDNFYLIPRVKGLNNSFQFLYSNTYKEKINSFKNSFDYIIFDTGPILSVPDTSILIDQGDINLIVVRHGINKINEIKQTIDTFAQIKKVPDGVIYNGYEKPNSYYGYYGIYGNYAYKYYAERYLYKTYEYDKKN